MTSPESLTRRTLVAFAWMFSGSGATALLQILVLFVLARLLGPAEFGLAGAGLLVVKLADLLARQGVGPAIVQIDEVTDDLQRTGFTLALLFGIVAGALVWLLGPALGAFFRMADLAPIVRALTVVFPLNGLTVVAGALLERSLRFKRIAAIEALSYALGYGAVGILLAWRGFGVWALVGAVLGQTAVRSVLLLVSRPHPARPLLARTELRRLISFAGGYTLTHLAAFFALQGEKLIVGRWLGQAALGIYGRAYSLAAAPVNLVARVMGRVLFPALSRVQSESRRLAAAYRRSFAGVALAMLPVSVTLAVIGPEVIEVVLGRQWMDAVEPFRILVLGLFLRAGHKVSAAVILAKGAVWRQAALHWIYAGLILCGAAVGQRWGVSGVAWAVLVAVSLHLVLMVELSLRLSGLRRRELLASLLPAVLCAGSVWAVVSWLAGASRVAGAPPVATTAAGVAGLVAVFGLFFWIASVTSLGRETRDLLLLLLGRGRLAAKSAADESAAARLVD